MANISWGGTLEITVGIACCFVLYKGFYIGKNIVMSYIGKRVKEELDKRMENEENEESFKPYHTNSAILKIKTGGKNHSVYVPFNRKISTPMLRKKVFLIKDGSRIEISQKPGIPYLICANDLGGQSIEVENMDGDVIHVYSENDIPSCF